MLVADSPLFRELVQCSGVDAAVADSAAVDNLAELIMGHS
jgi:hypothetical protein